MRRPMTALAALRGALASAGAARRAGGPGGAPRGPMADPMRPGGSTSSPSTPTATASLSRAELQARAVARLGEADANGDGALDRDELIARMPGARGGSSRSSRPIRPRAWPTACWR